MTGCGIGARAKGGWSSGWRREFAAELMGAKRSFAGHGAFPSATWERGAWEWDISDFLWVFRFSGLRRPEVDGYRLQAMANPETAIGADGSDLI
jgi:hypothetical protein